MTTQAPRHTVVVTGSGATTNGKAFLTANAWFKSQYPLNIYCDDEQVSAHPRGTAVVVERGNLKNGKDGKYESDYYYNLVEEEVSQRPPGPQSNVRDLPPVAPQSQGAGSARTSTSAPAAGSVPQGAPPAPKDAPSDQHQGEFTADRIKRVSIERQTALGRAVDWHIARIVKTSETSIMFDDNETLIKTAILFEQYLATGTAPQQEQEK